MNFKNTALTLCLLLVGIPSAQSTSTVELLNNYLIKNVESRELQNKGYTLV